MGGGERPGTTKTGAKEMSYNDNDEIAEVLATYELPGLPEPADDDTNTVSLVLFRFKDENIVLGDGFALADAQEYCQRDDTSGDGWFVGYRA
jgi:hypothetical protein